MAEKKKKSKKKDWLEGLKPEAFYKLINSDKLYGYREFCRILGIPIAPSGSTSQFRQLDMINMLCEYEKENSKFRFIRMRDERDIEVFQHQATYTHLIKCSLAKALLNEETQGKFINGILYITMPKLMEMCGMVNKNFNEIRNASNFKTWTIAMMHRDEFGKHGQGSDQLKRFVNVSYDVIKPLMRDAIKSMDNEFSLSVQRAYVAYIKKDDGHIINKHFLITSDEGKALFEICGNVLTEMDIENMRDLHFSNQHKIEQYYNRCNELCGEQLGYDGFYECYAIVLNQNRMEYMLKTSYSKALNLKVQDRLYEAKQFEELGNKFKRNLINATIALDTTYDFDQDYKSATQERAGN